MRKATAAQEPDNLKVTELKAIIADGFFEESRHKRDFFEWAIDECFDGISSFFVDNLGKVVAEGDGFEADCSVEGGFAFFCELLDCFLEISMYGS